MAQSPLFTLTTTSESVGIPESIADEIVHVAPWETKLLTAVGLDSLSAPCINTTHKYQDIEERPTRSLLNGAVTSGTTFVFDDAVFAAGDVVQIDEETIVLGTTADNLTFTSCTRSYGSTASSNHADNAPVLSIGTPRKQGAAAASTGDQVIMPNQITNYTQIFSKSIVVSGTSNTVSRYGRDGTEYDYQALRQMKILKKELENALLWGFAVAPATTATAGGMAGIYERIYSTATDLADAALTIANVEDGVEGAEDYGAKMDLICVGLYTKRIINSWGQSYVTHPTDPMDAVNMAFGVNVSRLDAGGCQMLVLPMDVLHAHVFQLDSSKIGVGPLTGPGGSRAFFHQYGGVTGDRITGQVIGEYTAEVPSLHSHKVFTSVKFA